MVQETETPVAAPAPVETPTEPVAPVEPSEEAPVETPEEEAPPAVPETYEAWVEHIAQKEEWKAADEERLAARFEEGKKEGQRRTQPLYERAAKTAKEYADKATEAWNYGGAMFSVLKKAADDGSIDNDLAARAIAQYAPKYAEVLGGLADIGGLYRGQTEFVTELAGNNQQIADEYGARLREAQLTGADESERKMIVRDLFDAVVAEREKKAEDKGYRRGLKEGQSASSRAAEAKAAAGAGPDSSQAKGGAHKRYADMTHEERAALSPAERDRLIAQQYGG